MGNDAYARTPAGMFQDIYRRIKALEHRLPPPQAVPPPPPQYGGSSAQRDAYYGVPATDPARVDLANQRITWFNTDVGWEESYYAPTGLSGLTAPALVSTAPAGWYPIGPGPECILQPNAAASSATGTYLNGWNGTVIRRGGAAWFTTSAIGIVTNKPGTWEMSAWTIQQSGTGIALFALRIVNIAGSVVLASREHAAEALQGSPATTVAEYKMTNVLGEGVQVLFFTVAGSLAVHQTAAAQGGVRGQMIARYLRPPFVTD